MAKKKAGARSKAKRSRNQISVAMPDLGLNRKQLNDLKKALQSTLVSSLEGRGAMITTKKTAPKIKVQTVPVPKYALTPSSED